MENVKPDVESFARIRVVGVGGSGKNAINHMINSKVKGVEFIVINTDAQDLHHSQAKKKIHIGKNLTRGLGTGMNPESGKKAAEDAKDEIQESLKGSDMVFIAGGTGGGTFSGASAVVARAAKDIGALTVGVATKPFFFEGKQRSKIAEQSLEELQNEVDALVVIPNDKLLSVIEPETSIENAFAMCDDVLKQAVEGISDIISTPGIINVDFADVRAVMENAGSALMGVGTASDDNRAEEAARGAINSPLLELSVNGAKGILFAIAGGENLGMLEIQDAAKIITESIDPEAKVIFGAIKDSRLKKNEIKITVIATGFPEGDLTGNAASLFEGQVATGQSQTSPSESAGKEANFEKQPEESTKNKNGLLDDITSLSTSEETPTKNNKAKSSTNKAEQTTSSNPSSDNKQKKERGPEDDDDDWGAVPAFLRRRR